MEIYLTRHGQDEDNRNGILNGHRDMPLTEIGEHQAKDIGEKIKKHSLAFDAVYASPLQRAHNTAKIISDVADQPDPTVLPDLIERDFGVMTGTLVKDIRKLPPEKILKTKIITYFLEPDDGETFPQTLSRAEALIQKLREKHEGGKVLVVTHGDMGKMIYAAFYNLPWKSVLIDFHLGNSELLLLSDDSDPGDTHLFTAEQHNH